jgi:hypothetical protein
VPQQAAILRRDRQVRIGQLVNPID